MIINDNAKKKILIVTDFYHPHISGITNSIDLSIKTLIKNNFKITILTGNYTGKLKEIEHEGNIKIIRTKILFNFSRGFYSIDLIRKFITESNKNDMVNIHYPLAEIFPLIFLTQKPIIFNYHCLPSYKSWFLKIITLYFYLFGIISLKISKNIIVFSKDYFLDFFLHKFFNKKLTEILPFSIVSPNKFEKKDTKKNKNFHIGYLGRLSEEKGIVSLVTASRILNHKKISHTLSIAGDLSDKRFKNYIDKIKKLCAQNQSIKLIGKINEAEKNNFFKEIDILILPSINSFEALGIVQLEAMMYGVPVIASNLPGVRVPILKTGNGYLFKSGDVIDLVAKILILKNKKLNTKEEIKEICLKYFNKEQFEKKLLNLFI